MVATTRRSPDTGTSVSASWAWTTASRVLPQRWKPTPAVCRRLAVLMRVSAGLDAGRVGLALVVPALALTSSGGLSIMPVEVTQMSTPANPQDNPQSGPQNDRLMLTWLGRFRAIQSLEGTSEWLAAALETLMERDPEDARADTEILWRLSAIRADEVMADTMDILSEVGL